MVEATSVEPGMLHHLRSSVRFKTSVRQTAGSPPWIDLDLEVTPRPPRHFMEYVSRWYGVEVLPSGARVVAVATYLWVVIHSVISAD